VYSQSHDQSTYGVRTDSANPFAFGEQKKPESDLRVLLVAPESESRRELENVLEEHGFGVISAGTGASAISLLDRHPIDIVVMSLTLVDMSGLALCAAVRKLRPTLPVLTLTRHAQDDEHNAAFEAGADDYIAEPVQSRLFILRARAALRRLGVGGPDRIQCAGITVDLAAHRVFVDETEIGLTSTEYRLVLLLIRSPGRVFSRRYLLDHIWNLPSHVVTRTVDTHVKRLRQKLGAAGSAIETVRGVGYRCIPPTS
jgi:two-component system phosphate regulon response regulator PhoB